MTRNLLPLTLLVVLGLASSSLAQSRTGQTDRYNGYPQGYADYGVNGGVYGVSIGGFGNYGLPGKTPSYDGHAFSGYGPGTSANAYFGYPAPIAGKTTPVKAKPLPRLAAPVRKPASKSPQAKPGDPREGTIRP